jgi:hypothetical protein
MGKRTAVAVRNLRHDPAKGAVPIQIGDGGGLYLQVAPGNAMYWVLRYKLCGRERLAVETDLAVIGHAIRAAVAAYGAGKPA